jgi:hypothetical protein
MKYEILVNITKQVILTVEAKTDEEARTIGMEEYDCISSDEEMEFPTDVEIISRSE